MNNPIVAKIIIYLFELVVVLIAFIAPIAIFIHSIIFLTIIDLITAIIRDKKIKNLRGKGELILESRIPSLNLNKFSRLLMYAIK